MKRRNTRPGRRLDARRMGGGGSLPLPIAPDSGITHFGEEDSGLSAPAFNNPGTGPVLFGRDVTSERSARRYRTGRTITNHQEAVLGDVVQNMRSWETYGMRLMVN